MGVKGNPKGFNPLLDADVLIAEVCLCVWVCVGAWVCVGLRKASHDSLSLSVDHTRKRASHQTILTFSRKCFLVAAARYESKAG